MDHTPTHSDDRFGQEKMQFRKLSVEEIADKPVLVGHIIQHARDSISAFIEREIPRGVKTYPSFVFYYGVPFGLITVSAN